MDRIAIIPTHHGDIVCRGLCLSLTFFCAAATARAEVTASFAGRLEIDAPVALALEAKGVIMVSNHPCDDPNPTESELYGTGALKKALSTFDIQLIDHIILAEESFFSFAEEKVTEI